MFTDDTVFECNVSEVFLKADRKVYKAPENLRRFTLTFVNQMDDIIFETQNAASVYKYNKFVDLKSDWMHIKSGSLGVNYTLINGTTINYIDVFESGKVVVETGARNDKTVGAIMRSVCSDLRLAIGREE